MITTDTGWLSPTGRWYSCGCQEHEWMAREILEAAEPGIWRGRDRVCFGDPERELERLGWIKLAGRNGPFSGRHPPTPRQNRALLEWCTGKGQGRTELPWWLEPDAKTEKVATAVRTSPGQPRS